MVTIKNTHVYNLGASVVASGNSMRIVPEEVTEETFQKSMERATKLVSIGGGTGHSNFRTGILVSFDLKYPQYFTKQLQRYHWIQYVSSTSMMHRITKMDFSKCCNKYVSKDTISRMNMFVNLYDKLTTAGMKFWEIVKQDYVPVLKYCYGNDFEPFPDDITRGEVLYDCYMRIVSNCPMGAELWVHVTTNYEQLATIYKQRKEHKLKEDWGYFCNWIESLPYAKELICNFAN